MLVVLDLAQGPPALVLPWVMPSPLAQVVSPPLLPLLLTLQLGLPPEQQQVTQKILHVHLIQRDLIQT